MDEALYRSLTTCDARETFEGAVKTFRLDIQLLRGLVPGQQPHKDAVQVLLPLRDACRSYLGLAHGDRAFNELVGEALDG